MKHTLLSSLLVGLAVLAAVNTTRSLSAAPALPSLAAGTASTASTVMLVRHAETAASTETTRDPELSEDGEQRAAALARLLSHARVTHLFASEFQRTQATLAPLAEARGIEVVVVGAREAQALVTRLRALPPGAVAVVAGHSNTVPGLVEALGGEAHDLVEHETYGRMLRSDEYDRLFVVHLPGAAGAGEGAGERAAAATLELRYGAGS